MGIDYNGEKIVGLGVIGENSYNNGNPLQTLHIYDGCEGVVSFEAEEYDEESKLYFF